jgi:GINS complex subunit 3
MTSLDPKSVPEGFDYYDIDSILSEENTVPCELRHGCTGVGTVLDPGADVATLPPNAKVDLPMWMVQVMAKRQLLHVHLPIYFKDHMRRKLRAGAGCENLRVRCNYFYSVAHKVHEAMVACGEGDETFPDFIAGAFAARYRDLLTRAPTLDTTVDVSDIQGKLSNEELRLFNDAIGSSAEYERWRGGGSSYGIKKSNSLSHKRPRGAS